MFLWDACSYRERRSAFCGHLPQNQPSFLPASAKKLLRMPRRSQKDAPPLLLFPIDHKTQRSITRCSHVSLLRRTLFIIIHLLADCHFLFGASCGMIHMIFCLIYAFLEIKELHTWQIAFFFLPQPLRTCVSAAGMHRILSMSAVTHMSITRPSARQSSSVRWKPQVTALPCSLSLRTSELRFSRFLRRY